MLDDAAQQMPAGPAVPLEPAAGALCWQLSRPCALTPRQMLTSYAVLVVASSLVALVCSLQGWWIVAVYCALEMVLAGALYLLYMVHAVDGERITLAPGGLLTVEVARGLRQHRVEMNPAWTRLERQRSRSRSQRDTLWLCSSQSRIEVASQLGPVPKQRLERELRRALATRQQGQEERDTPCAPHPRHENPPSSASNCY
ncbi:MAG: DUF2244 domain-containing protein [Polaromonas sp.]